MKFGYIALLVFGGLLCLTSVCAIFGLGVSADAIFVIFIISLIGFAITCGCMGDHEKDMKRIEMGIEDE